MATCAPVEKVSSWRWRASNLGIIITGKLIIEKLSEFIGILTAKCCTAIYDRFRGVLGANSSFEAVSEVFWELIAPNLIILLLFRSNVKYKIILKD